MNHAENYCHVIKRMCNRVVLPPEYQPVEYIQTVYSDTSILTGVTKVTNNTSFEIEFEINDTRQNPIIALRTQSTVGMYFGRYNGGCYQFGNSKNLVYPEIPTNERTKFKIDKNIVYRYNYTNNTYEYIVATNSDTFSVSGSLPIFCEYYGTSYSQYIQGKLFAFKLWEFNELMCDMVPCYRKTDNLAGCYERIKKQFIIARSGAFIVSNNN